MISKRISKKISKKVLKEGLKRRTDMKEITVRAVSDRVGEVTDFINEELDRLECPVKAQMQIDIAVDEIFSNIAKYAYPPGEGTVTVRLDEMKEPRGICMVFIDTGTPYDPMDAPEPDITLPLEEREAGGLGIFMVKNIMDKLLYDYRNGQNILKIWKFF